MMEEAVNDVDSIASDFSVIPEMDLHQCEDFSPMSSSFFISQHSQSDHSDSFYQEKRDVTTGNDEEFLAKKVLSLRVKELTKQLLAASSALSFERCVKDELMQRNLTKDRELGNKQKIIEDLEAKISSLVLQEIELKEQLSDVTNAKTKLEEKQAVLLSDNEHLQNMLKTAQEELSTANAECGATEKVAVDLRKNMQSFNADSLAIANERLMKKMKKFNQLLDSHKTQLENLATDVIPLEPAKPIAASSASTYSSHSSMEFMSECGVEFSMLSLERKMESIEKELKLLRTLQVGDEQLPHSIPAPTTHVTPSAPLPTTDVLTSSSGPSGGPQSQNITVPQSAMGGIQSPLPPPLQPQATEIARHAAVQFQLNACLEEIHNGQPVEQEQVLCHSREPTTDMSSDSADHNASEVRESGEIGNVSCPMCSLMFEVCDIRLLEEHINIKHLDRICPVCSRGFERATSFEEFEEHVQSHFDETSSDVEPSGRQSGWSWGPMNRFGLLDID